SLRMILMRDRRAKKGHDAVAGVLVDRAFEAVHALSEELEEAVHDLVPLFGIDLRGEIHGALHVREEDRHLLALPFEGAAGGEDLLGEVLRRIGEGVRSQRLYQWLCTRIAELPTFGVRRAAARAGQCRRKGRGTF